MGRKPLQALSGHGVFGQRGECLEPLVLFPDCHVLPTDSAESFSGVRFPSEAILIGNDAEGQVSRVSFRLEQLLDASGPSRPRRP